MGRSHKKPEPAQPSELSALVACVGKIIGTRADDLRIAAQELPDSPGQAAQTLARSNNVSELQASFQALAHCALVLEAETERLHKLTRISQHERSSDNDTHTSSDTL